MAAFGAVNAIACAPTIGPHLGPGRQSSSWLSYLGTPRHDASATESLSPEPRPEWHTVAGRAIRGSPAFGESVVAVGVAERYVVLLSRATGQVFWRAHLQGTIDGGPLLDGDRLYVGTQTAPQGRVYALRLRDGGTVWRTTVGSVEAPLALDGDAVFVGTEGGLLLRLSKTDGSIVWRRRLSGAIRAAPVPTPAGVAVATTSDSLFLVDPGTGAVRQRLPTPGSVLGAPASDGAHLYFGTTGGHILCVDLAAFAVRWDRPAGDAVFGPVALSADTVFALARNGTLWILPVAAPESGRSFAFDLIATAGPTPLATTVVIAGVGGEVLLADRATGAVVWRAHLDGPIEQPPLVRDHQLVVVAGRGDIHAYR